MKKVIPLILVLCLLLTSCSLSGDVVDVNEMSLTQTVTEVFVEETEETVTGADGEEVTDSKGGILTTVREVTNVVVSVINVTVATTKVPSSAASTARPTTAKPDVPASSTAPTSPQSSAAPADTTAGTAAVTTSAPTVTKKEETTTAPSPRKESAPAGELRGIWLSYYEIPTTTGKSSAQYSAAVDKIFANIASLGLNTVYVHVRPCCDSYYPSDIFPWSKYLTGTQGAGPGYDPFALMISAANKYGLSVHAWVNPFRVASGSDYTVLSKDNPARKIIEAGNADGEVVILSKGIYFNPANKDAQNLIIRGVKEILSRYNVDGIHIDDYFYPSTAASVDKKEYDEYLASGGTLALNAWRKSTINQFVANMYSAVKAYGNNKVFSISPSGSMSANETTNFADTATWLSKGGYADLVIPQIYYGFNHSSSPFKAVTDSWGASKTSSAVKLACGLAFYKAGETDSYAGKASSEWVNNHDIIKRQVQYVRSNPKYCGFVLFTYSYVFGTTSAQKAEYDNLKTIM